MQSNRIPAVLPNRSKSSTTLLSGDQKPTGTILVGNGFARNYSDVSSHPPIVSCGFRNPNFPPKTPAIYGLPTKRRLEEILLNIRPSENVPQNPSPVKKLKSDSFAVAPEDLPMDDLTDLSKWGLPSKIVAAYRRCGISNMFPWQAECLREGFTGKNLVYSAPTSAGKTLVAEILLLKKVVETRKKGLFILPFISVAREKMASLQKMLKGAGVRVDGYMGHLHPKAGLVLLDVAVCTIEKANSLINRLVDEKTLSQIGVIVVDELHMVGDPQRGYLIELLLTKVQYLNKMARAAGNTDVIQIIGMSATLPNLHIVAKWLDAELYFSNYRPVPLLEMVKLGQRIYDKNWKMIREVPFLRTVKHDSDHIVSLCFETVQAGHSVLVFCPSKTWCESLAGNIAFEFSALAPEVQASFIQKDKLHEVREQLRQSPAGLDGILAKTVPFVTAFHHAGLTMDEREIIEEAFRKCYVKVLIATTTLSCGVNLPARRVIIRSPMFNQSIMDTLTYYQMAGRAGRKGVDTKGESILICKEPERSKVVGLFASTMRPVKSCLEQDPQKPINPAMLRALLEIIANGAARSISQVNSYMQCTLFSVGLTPKAAEASTMDVINLLEVKELISIGREDDLLSPTQLGNAIVWSGLSLSEGFSVFQELEKARTQLNLENELHILYLVTPLYLIEQVAKVDWYHYMELWQQLPEHFVQVGLLVGVEERTIMTAVRGRFGNESDPVVAKQLASMRRFYCALMLNELASEVPLSDVARKYQCNKGILQSLQQGASTYAGMVAVFCEQLGGSTWSNMALLIEQFQSRLMFGVQRELVELARIECISARQARTIYKAGYQNLTKLAAADRFAIEELLRSAMPFQSKSNNSDVLDGKLKPVVLLKGYQALSDLEAAEILIKQARSLLEADIEAMGMQNFSKISIN